MISDWASIRRAATGALALSLLPAGAARAQTLPSPATVAAALASGGTRLGAPLQHADGGSKKTPLIVSHLP